MAKTKLGSLGLTADIVNGTMTATDLTGGNGGTDGFQLTTDGTGTGALSWAASGSGTGSLAGLSDTTFAATATGQIIVHNGTAWINVVPPSAGDVTIAADGTMTIGLLKVDTGELAADAVEGSKIANDAVDTEHIAADAVTTAEILDATIAFGNTNAAFEGRLPQTITMSAGTENGSNEIILTFAFTTPSGGNTSSFVMAGALMLRVSDAQYDPTPSADTVFSAGSAGDLVDGTGTATAWVKGDFGNDNMIVTLTGPAGSATRYIHVIGGNGSMTTYNNAGGNSVTFA